MKCFSTRLPQFFFFFFPKPFPFQWLMIFSTVFSNMKSVDLASPLVLRHAGMFLFKSVLTKILSSDEKQNSSVASMVRAKWWMPWVDKACLLTFLSSWLYFISFFFFLIQTRVIWPTYLFTNCWLFSKRVMERVEADRNVMRATNTNYLVGTWK